MSSALGLPALSLLLASTLHATVPGDLTRVVPTDGAITVQAEGITVRDAWARASAGAATTGAAYLTLIGGARPDQLVGASTPVAATTEVHQTITENGVMKMRAAPDLPIPMGQTVTFAPGGLHIMLMGLKHPLMVGQSFPLTLTFAHAAPLTVDVKVRGLGNDAKAAMGDHMMGGHMAGHEDGH